MSIKTNINMEILFDLITNSEKNQKRSLVHASINPLTPEISLVILPTVCHTNLMMLVQSIRYRIK